MTDEHNSNDTTNDDVFIAEADEFDDDLDAKLPAWPKVVGIISIIWGALGLICNGFGVASAFLMPMMMGGAAGQLEGGMPSVITDPPITGLIAAVLGVLLSVFLVIAGVMTVMRKADGRTAHLIYAPIHLILIVWGAMVQLGAQSEIADWVQANPDADFAKQQQMTGPIGMIMLVVFVILFLIWPVFCLVWFGAIKKTHEDMTGGVEIDTI